MSKYYYVWEVLWTQREYGGPSHFAGSSLHITLEDALAYKQSREGDRSIRPPVDPFFEDGSAPQRKEVSKAVYRRIKAASPT